MPRFSINVSFMLHEHSFLDRFSAAADLGFSAVDIQFPYDHPPESIAKRARAAGVEVVLVNLPAGDRATGEMGIAALPERRTAFRDGITQAIAYCRALGNRRVNVLAGCVPEGVSKAACATVLVENLRRCADIFAREDITVMLEPINGHDAPGFLVQTAEDACALLDRAGHENLALQFDLYHCKVMRGDPLPALKHHLSRIAHVQFADAPGRHEPGTGEIDLARAFATLDDLGYAGWVGAEYLPTGTTAESLGWYDPWRARC